MPNYGRSARHRLKPGGGWQGKLEGNHYKFGGNKIIKIKNKKVIAGIAVNLKDAVGVAVDPKNPVGVALDPKNPAGIAVNLKDAVGVAVDPKDCNNAVELQT